jgi:hypothetical protein
MLDEFFVCYIRRMTWTLLDPMQNGWNNKTSIIFGKSSNDPSQILIQKLNFEGPKSNLIFFLNYQFFTHASFYKKTMTFSITF